MYNELEMYKSFKNALQDITNIKNIKIGGRNLIVHTNEYKNTNLDTTGTKVSNPTTNTMRDFIPVTPNEVLYFQKTTSGEYFRWNWYDADKNFISRKPDNNNSFSWTVPANTHYIWVSYPNTGDVQIERGNKPTDFRPAPEDIESALNSKANSADVYKKTETYSQTEINTKLNTKANSVDVYKKTEIDTKLSTKANSSDVYTKTETDTLLDNKANTDDVYTKTETYTQTEIDTKLKTKANSTDVYKKTEVDTKVSTLQGNINNKANSADVYKKTETYSQTEINTKLSSKANSADVYKKTEIDTKLGTKANSADVYTKTQTDTKLNAKANSSDVYKKTETYSQKEIDDKLSTAGTVDTYTKTELDTKFGAKANSADVYTKTQADNTFATKTTVTTNTTNIATNKTNITNLTTKFNNNRIFSVSSMAELESVLKTATAGTEIRIKAGTYTVDRSFQIPKGVTIKGSGDDSCIFKCNNTSINNVFRNKLTGNETGYNKFNITIEGINFDGVNTTHNITAVAFAHATNVTVRDCTFQRFNSWHCIEFNGCKHCYIKYNNFLDYGYTSGGNPSEVIQIDFCNNSTNYPWTAKYDNTHCKFIYIEENNFYKIKTTSTGAIGTHNYDSNGGRHEYIYVRNNSIDTVQSFFHLLGSHRIHIESNSGVNLQTFVTLGNNGFLDQNEGTICNNTVSGDFVTGIWGGGATSSGEGRFVYGKDNTITIYGFIITGNVCNDFNRHTIGLTCSDTTISNNRIYGSGRHGVWIYGGEKITYTGNVAMNCGKNTTGSFTGIYIGNNSAQNVNHSLFIGNVGGIAISDNVDRGNIIEVNNVTL